MKNILRIFMAVALLLGVSAPLLSVGRASADNYLTDDFTGSSLTGTWISGGTPNSACLTASTSTTAGIPGCNSVSAVDTVGNGALRLTQNINNQAGFVINQTPISTAKGLQISFDMYQYHGTGADGIAFFLIDGSKSPTQAGAFGGSLGYSNNNTGTPGLVGGYVGVGFDAFGNFSNPSYGTGGPGARANNITVRGSEASGYQYVTNTAASASISSNSATVRANAKRHVIISISTNNVMTVYVDYNNGQGIKKELSNINLNTINGAGTLPTNLKFGFSASTGGSNNTHEINALSATTLSPNVGATITNAGGTVYQGETGTYTIAVKNDAGAETTTGDITFTDTLPSGLKPTAATGTGWSCNIVGQALTCTRPGSGANALAPGASAPNITLTATASNNAGASLANTSFIATENNNPVNDPGFANTFTIAAGDKDGATTAIETAAPHAGDANNDGTADTLQANVTSFVSPLSGSYVTLATDGDCGQNNDPYVAAVAANAVADKSYNYPAGMMSFSITCTAPGDTTTVSQYYYGDYDASQFVARKYDSAHGVYVDIPGAVITNVVIGGQKALKITYDITDGGPLDADGLANGTIVDPAGPAIKAPAAATANGGTLANTGTEVLAAVIIAALLTGASIVVYRRPLLGS